MVSVKRSSKSATLALAFLLQVCFSYVDDYYATFIPAIDIVIIGTVDVVPYPVPMD